MSLATAQQMMDQAQEKVNFYRDRFNMLLGGLPGMKALEFKYILDELLFWTESAATWQRHIEFYTAKEAVYPPPAEAQCQTNITK